MTNWSVVCDDILNWCKSYDGEPFHAALMDPPYHLKGGFMSKAWDRDGPDAIAFQPFTWAAIADHLYPGAFLMAFGGSRTHHRMAIAMEDAGLILHPTMVWLNGQSFPKATRIDTQIDKAAGAEREVVGTNPNVNGRISGGIWGEGIERPWKDRVREGDTSNANITAPATPLAATWQGHRYGLQALKPCAEFILVAQKPYAGKPVESIVSTGAGALWIDGGRVGTELVEQGRNGRNTDGGYGKGYGANEAQPTQGRWPPNVCLTHAEGCVRVGTRRVKNESGKASGPTSSVKVGYRTIGDFTGERGDIPYYADPDGLETVEAWDCVDGCPVKALGEQSGESLSKRAPRGGTSPNPTSWGDSRSDGNNVAGHNDTGTAARFYPNHDWQYEIAERSFDYAQDRLAGVTPFYYCAKSARRERDAGLEGFEYQQGFDKNTSSTIRRSDPDTGMVREFKYTPSQRRNNHPCCKPIALALWLARLLAPPPEYAPRRLLVPFSGSGSEICSAILSGCWEDVTGVELEPDYVSIAHARVSWWQKAMELTKSSDPKDILRLMKRIETKQGEVHDHQLELFEQHHLP